GEYELRLGPSAPQTPVPGPLAGGPRGPGGSGRTRTPGREVPPQRRRGSGQPAPGRRGGRAPQKKPKARKVLLWTGGTMAFVVLATGTAGYLYLKHLEGNVTTTDVGDAARSNFSKD